MAVMPDPHSPRAQPRRPWGSFWGCFIPSPTPNRSLRRFWGQLTARDGNRRVPRVGAAEPWVPPEMFPALHWGHRPHPLALHLLLHCNPNLGRLGRIQTPSTKSQQLHGESSAPPGLLPAPSAPRGRPRRVPKLPSPCHPGCSGAFPEPRRANLSLGCQAAGSG